MIKKIVVVLVFSLVTSFAFAEVMVVDYSSDAKNVKGSAKSFAVKSEPEFIAAPVPAISTSGLSSDQRINKLEQQISNLNEQSLTTKIDELQQRFQKLSGQIEDQKHQIEQLNSQLRSFYQDLNQRLEKPGSEKAGLGKAKTSELAVVDTASNASIAPVTTTGEVVEVIPNSAGASSTTMTADVAATKKNDEAKPKTDKASLKEQQMYQTAIDLLPDKKYEASGNKLRDYLRIYPKGIYVANAHYWLGEINFLQKNYDAAEEEFKIVTDKYSKSKRASDAMFKLALVHQNQGRDAQAKQELKQVMKRYSGTSAAQLAKLQLEGN
ncbi:Cell division coordinator CpoB [Gammaproteobacteria bacterium]